MHEINTDSTRALVVFNPNAGQAGVMEQALHEACEVWRGAGWTVDLRPTEAAGDATRIAREAADEGYDIVIAAGGDGTVNEVVNGLVGTRSALGTLPVGTVNVWAREIGMPLQPLQAAEALLRAELRRVDLGRAGERYFLLMASLGFDASVTANIRSEQKRRLGALAYVLQALKVSFSYEGVRARIRIDGRMIRGRFIMVVLGNSQLYGGVIKLTANAVIDDGLLDVCVIKGRSLAGIPLRLWSFVTRRASSDPQIAYYRARRVVFTSSPAIDVQVDGDYIGRSPMTFAIAPGALVALIPPEVPADLMVGRYPSENSALPAHSAEQLEARNTEQRALSSDLPSSNLTI